MSIHEFYSQFVSSDERTPLFVALRRLSALGEPGNLIRQFVSTGWPSWDTPPQSGSTTVGQLASHA
jgi:hypothetical protein